MTKLEAVRIALWEAKREGIFDTLSLTKRVREIIPENKWVTDGTVTRYIRMLGIEFPYECTNRLMGQYKFTNPTQTKLFGGGNG